MTSINNIKDKTQIFGANNIGLFGILKKDTTESGSSIPEKTKKLVIETKKSFISQCASSRGRSKNKELDQKTAPADNDLNVQIDPFVFVKGPEATPTTLVPKDPRHFNSWFKANYSTIAYTQAQ